MLTGIVPQTWQMMLAGAPVEVLAARFDDLSPHTDALQGVLSADERADAAIRGDRAGARRFVLARGWLRSVLAGRLEKSGCLTAPESLVIERQKGGKPRLVAGQGALHFNLSHGAGWVVVALCSRRDVGVDVEAYRPRPVDDPLRIARRWFAPAEIDALVHASGEDARDRLFLELWSLKEAVSKAQGRGMAAGLGLDVLPVLTASEQTARVRCEGGLFDVLRPLSLPDATGHFCVAAREEGPG